MANVARPKSLLARPARLLSTRPRRLALPLAAVWALSLALILGAAPASALVSEVSGTKVGMQPRELARWWDGAGKFTGLRTQGEANAPALGFANKSANPVLHSLRTYLVYWDPQNYYDGDWQNLIDRFMASAGSASGQLANVFAVVTQYRDGSNQPAAGGSSFQGAYTDTNPYPGSGCADPRPLKFSPTVQEITLPVCMTDGQLRAQLQTFISQHGLPQGMGVAYDILTPPGVTVCLDGGGNAGHCSDFYPGTAGEVKKLEEEKIGTLGQIEKEEKEKEEKERKKELFIESERLKSYKQSFCSYHGAIGSGEGSTILYGAIPWTAGGFGTNEFEPAGSGHDCQDGGFEPNSQPGELAVKEQVHPRTPKEEEEFAKKSPQEKREQEEAEALGLQGPHAQQPNQLGNAFDFDGDHDQGLADLVVNQIAVEQQNMVTNPLMNAWQDSQGREVTDECRNFFLPILTGSAQAASPWTGAGSLSDQLLGPTTYYLNTAFNMAAYRLSYPHIACPAGVKLMPQFTAPNAVNSGELAGFDGMESNITLDATPSYPSQKETYATFSWNFGDGSPTVTGYGPGAPSVNSPGAAPCEAPWLAPCAASAFHAYQYGGTYYVTLTVTDVSGNTTSAAHAITVVGPPPPAPSAGSAGAGAGAGAAAGGSSGGSGAGAKPVPVPSAAAAVVSHSLRRVLRRGLVVRYSVGERVTGHFEVLIASSLARRLRLHGPPATGLASGTPPQTVIGKAFLVTAAGGRNTVTIQFSKSTATRLAKLHGVSLMLRLVVRNAASGTSTVVSTVTLSR